MQEIRSALTALRRPTLLIRAARFGLASYDRDAVLKRIFGMAVPPTGRSCISRLLEIEAEMDTTRRNGDATYSIARHVEALIAVMAESRTVATGSVDVQPKASAIVDFRRETYSLS